MRQDLDSKLVAMSKRDLGSPSQPDAGRCTGDDDGAGRQRRSLGQEAHELRDAEDEIADCFKVSTSAGRGTSGLGSLCATLLHDFAVPEAAQHQLGRVRHQRRRYQRGPWRLVSK